MHATWNEPSKAYDPEFEDAPEKAPKGEPPASRLAILSLISGISGFFLPLVGPITAVVSGHVARDEVRKSRGRLGGDALARTGLILGYIWLGLTAAALVVVGIVATHVARGRGVMHPGGPAIVSAPGLSPMFQGDQLFETEAKVLPEPPKDEFGPSFTFVPSPEATAVTPPAWPSPPAPPVGP